MSAKLQSDVLFGALTRPQMFAGVTYGFFIANAVITAELFILLKSFLVLPAALVIHAAGCLACLYEPRFFDLWYLRLTRCPRLPNWTVWRCNSYSP